MTDNPDSLVKSVMIASTRPAARWFSLESLACVVNGSTARNALEDEFGAAPGAAGLSFVIKNQPANRTTIANSIVLPKSSDFLPGDPADTGEGVFSSGSALDSTPLFRSNVGA